MRLPYPLLCALVGLVVGWFPKFFHGPIPEKFDLYYFHGYLAVWAYYLARLLIGVAVGISVVPALWYVRGPLVGAVMMVPCGFISLANPSCGPTCMFWNMVTGAIIGTSVGAVAFWATGKHHCMDAPDRRYDLSEDR